MTQAMNFLFSCYNFPSCAILLPTGDPTPNASANAAIKKHLCRLYIRALLALVACASCLCSYDSCSLSPSVAERSHVSSE